MKNLFVISVLMLMSYGVFCQTTPEAVLKSSDVENFIKNYNGIVDDFEHRSNKIPDRWRGLNPSHSIFAVVIAFLGTCPSSRGFASGFLPTKRRHWLRTIA